MWLEGRRRGMWCGGFPIPAARSASTYCFALEQDSRSCTPYKAGEEKELCLFKHFLISLRTEWRSLLINSLPPSFSNPVSREKEFFSHSTMISNDYFLFLCCKWLRKKIKDPPAATQGFSTSEVNLLCFEGWCWLWSGQKFSVWPPCWHI